MLAEAQLARWVRLKQKSTFMLWSGKSLLAPEQQAHPIRGMMGQSTPNLARARMAHIRYPNSWIGWEGGHDSRRAGRQEAGG